MTRQAKEITVEEARHLFLTHVAVLVDYWEKESRVKTSQEKLEGLAFSLLTMLDGGSAGLPGYQIIPRSYQQDVEYAKEQGYDYYPENIDITQDQALHEEIYKYFEGKAPKFPDLYDFGAYLSDLRMKDGNNVTR